jgi:hypothetical protein
MSEGQYGRSPGGDGGFEKEPLPEAIQSVLAALDHLKFGAIQLTVHEGRLVQVDITERKRFAS